MGLKVFDKNLKAHRTTNIFYLIIIIPFLLLAIFSATIMFNAKNAGGYANIFGYYVIEFENNNFYDSTKGEYKSGTKQMFKRTPIDNITEGDLIAFYSKPSDTKLIGEDWEWIYFSANTSPQSQLSNFEETTPSSSEVKIVKVGPKKAVYVFDENVTYTGFTYYESKNGALVDNVNQLILADDVIGVAVPTSAFIAGAIDYAKSPESLLLLVLLPCTLLLLIKFISLAFYHRYEASTGNIKRKANIVGDEQTTYSQPINANRSSVGAPPRPSRVSAVRRQTPPTPPRRPPSPPPRPTRKGQ